MSEYSALIFKIITLSLNKGKQNAAMLLIFLLTALASFSQTEYTAPVTDIKKIRLSEYFPSDGIGLAIWNPELTPADLPDLDYDFNALSRHRGAIPGELIENKIVFQFALKNSSETDTVINFLPGFYISEIEIFKSPLHQRDSIYQIKDSRGKLIRTNGFFPIPMLAGEEAVIYAKFSFLRTNSNRIAPRLIRSHFVEHWFRWRKSLFEDQDILTYLASGLLLLMILYSLAVYIQNRRIEFIYYSLYAFFTGILLFFKAYFQLRHTPVNFFFEEYLDLIILCGGVFFYFRFVRNFLETSSRHPQLNTVLKYSEWLLWLLLLVYSSIYFFTEKYILLNIMENLVIKLLLLVIGIIFIIHSLKKDDKLLKYIGQGNIALIFFSAVSLILMTTRIQIIPSRPSSLLNKSMFYYELGLILELIFFLMGLAWKNKTDIIQQVKEKEALKREKERQEFENQMAVLNAQQEERDRISADMHDELGSGVTVIRLMSEIVKSKMKDNILPEIEKISHSANELLGKMNTIIWTMKSSNDSVESLIAYIRAYAIEFFDTTPVNCIVNVSMMSDSPMSGEKRRNIFLSIKEALNNILKHSQATSVQIDILIHNNKLIIRIQDNGTGLEEDKLRRFGNGLSNMRKRMLSLNGKFNIENVGGGTRVSFTVPI